MRVVGELDVNTDIALVTRHSTVPLQHPLTPYTLPLDFALQFCIIHTAVCDSIGIAMQLYGGSLM